MGGTPAPASSELMWAAVIAGVATLLLAVFHHHDRSQTIRRHYLRHNPALYQLLQLCVFVLTVAAAFNARYLATWVLRAVWARGVGPSWRMLIRHFARR